MSLEQSSYNKTPFRGDPSLCKSKTLYKSFPSFPFPSEIDKNNTIKIWFEMF